MSNVTARYRSMLRIDADDLKRLLEIAQQDRREFFRVNPKWRTLYSKHTLCVALCQGAAQHFVDGKTGINDFDVYTFYKTNPRKTWYSKRIKSYDFGDPKFGKSKDRPEFVGRRVDCLSRAIEVRNSENCTSTLRRYLTEKKTETAQLLAEKAVVLLEPDLGKVVWPKSKISNQQS